jgi:Ca2+-binding RTX toxin-like protein
MNQQENREDDIKTESLADLELTTEQADETKGGAGRDVLIGGIGNDWLSGGSGQDR